MRQKDRMRLYIVDERLTAHMPTYFRPFPLMR